MARFSPLQIARRLRGDTSGASMILVTLALPVVVGGLGLGVDVAMWYGEKRAVQQIADTASLGAARAMRDGATLDVARTVAINDAARNGYVAGVNATLTVNSPPTSGPNMGVAGAVEVLVTRKLPSVFSKVFMSSTGWAHGRSVAKMGSRVQGKNLEVALMLDVSSSMNSSSGTAGVTKLKAMQDGAKALIDEVVQPVQTPFTSRVSLVPYSSSVNVGSARYTAITGKPVTSGWTTVTERSGAYAFTDDAPGAGTYFAEFRTRKNSAYGAYASSVANYTSNVPAAAISALSANTATLKGSIDGLTGKGTTAGHLGVAWTWYTLSPKWNTVFTGAAAPIAYGETTQKVAVLLSDFDMNSYYKASNGNSTEQTRALCTAMKAAGIVIYTLGYNVDQGNTTAVNLWKDCATDAGKRYTAETADDLLAAFRQIASSTVSAVSTTNPALAE
ncbi:MAG: hypothetical protein IPK81_21330 [Rhodospirillales bacterium]|nr:MAG: hypothetical protein IPK81_21330 [Rhodospirillales bacterium]